MSYTDCRMHTHHNRKPLMKKVHTASIFTGQHVLEKRKDKSIARGAGRACAASRVEGPISGRMNSQGAKENREVLVGAACPSQEERMKADALL